MFSNLTLYYLNQIGITPWVNKESPPKLATNSVSVGQDTTKLIIVSANHISNQAQSLLKRILSYINIAEQELLVINPTANDPRASQQLMDEITKVKSPLAMLTLGLSEDFFIEYKPSYPIVSGLSIDYLLNNPLAKKKMFHDLNYIKNLVATN